MLFYKIADITLAVRTTNQYVIDRLSPFLINAIDRADMYVEMQAWQDISLPEGEMVSDEGMMKWIRKSSPDTGYFAFLTNPVNRPIAAVDADIYWTSCKVYYQGDIVSSDPDTNPPDILALQFLGIAFRNHIIYKNSIVLHASCIEYKGKGLAFTAPSGTGKSTHVSLWEQYKEGTNVINDDAPVIRLTDGRPVLYGTPWSGSSDKFLNMSVPLTAIVLLEQDGENSIRQVNTIEAVTGVMPRLLLPYHDSAMMELSLSLFEKIVSSVPVYKLKCRPDAEAVELVYKCIM